VCILDIKRVVGSIRDFRASAKTEYFSCILKRKMPERVDMRNEDCVKAVLPAEDTTYAKAFSRERLQEVEEVWM
jgi:hypothetical protein